nr:helix-turn-helix domain-containing protein [uncultured Oscillibacter sp.]
MRPKPRGEDQLLPFETIEAATRGDITAINSVLAHFEGYIAKLATRTLYDEHGCPCQYLDPELKRRLETKLIVRVLNFMIA